MTKITTEQLLHRMGEILGDDFFLSDMLDQDELFEMQEQLVELIADACNSGCRPARTFLKTCPKTFSIE